VGWAKMENRYIHFGIVLGLIAAISAGILGGVNDFTSKVIAENTKKIVNAARIEVLPEAADFKEEEAKEVEGIQYIPGFNAAGEIVGYVASVTEPGYGGDINFVVGINNWIGKDATYEFNKSVDAFAGATISPKAVYTGVKRALNTYQNGVSK